MSSTKTKHPDLISQNKVFLWIALGTGLLLMIPAIGMQLSSEWDWNLPDFIIAGTLIFGMCSLFVVTARIVRKKKHRLFFGIAFALALLYLYAELAVGIFTNWGS